MSITNQMEKVPLEATRSAMMSSINQSIAQLLKVTNSNDSVLRKILIATSATAFGASLSLLGYRFYRTYKLKKNSFGSNNLFQDIDFEANLNKSLRPIEEIEEIERRLQEFKLSEDTLLQIMEILDNELQKGLSWNTNAEADLKMLPTYVTQLPTGNENNDILALDLGGSNFRVLLIRLRKNEEPKILNKVFIVSESIMKGSGTNVIFNLYKDNLLTLSGPLAK